MEYLPTFGLNLWCMQVNIPYMEHMGNIFYFHPTWGRFPFWLINMFQMGWNQQQKLNGTESQRTPDQVSCDRAIRYSGFRSVGPVGDFLEWRFFMFFFSGGFLCYVEQRLVWHKKFCFFQWERLSHWYLSFRMRALRTWIPLVCLWDKKDSGVNRSQTL